MIRITSIVCVSLVALCVFCVPSNVCCQSVLDGDKQLNDLYSLAQLRLIHNGMFASIINRWYPNSLMSWLPSTDSCLRTEYNAWMQDASKITGTLREVLNNGVVRFGVAGLESDQNTVSEFVVDPLTNTTGGYYPDFVFAVTQEMSQIVQTPLNYTFVFFPYTDFWGDFLRGLNNHNFDITLPQIIGKLERAKQADFTCEHNRADHMVVVIGSMPLPNSVTIDNTTTLQQLQQIVQNNNLTIIAEPGTAQADHVKLRFPTATITSLSSSFDNYAALANGTLGNFLIDFAQNADGYSTVFPNLRIIIPHEYSGIGANTVAATRKNRAVRTSITVAP